MRTETLDNLGTALKFERNRFNEKINKFFGQNVANVKKEIKFKYEGESDESNDKDFDLPKKKQITDVERFKKSKLYKNRWFMLSQRQKDLQKQVEQAWNPEYYKSSDYVAFEKAENPNDFSSLPVPLPGLNINTTKEYLNYLSSDVICRWNPTKFSVEYLLKLIVHFILNDRKEKLVENVKKEFLASNTQIDCESLEYIISHIKELLVRCGDDMRVYYNRILRAEERAKRKAEQDDMIVKLTSGLAFPELELFPTNLKSTSFFSPYADRALITQAAKIHQDKLREVVDIENENDNSEKEEEEDVESSSESEEHEYHESFIDPNSSLRRTICFNWYLKTRSEEDINKRLLTIIKANIKKKRK